MKILGPTRFQRLNEAGALVFLFAGLFFSLSLVSYQTQDPSWNLVSGAVRAHNLTGVAGSYIADLFLQVLGLSAFAIPVLLWMLAWRWVRSAEIQAPGIKIAGSGLLMLSVSRRALAAAVVAPLERRVFGRRNNRRLAGRLADRLAQPHRSGAAHVDFA